VVRRDHLSCLTVGEVVGRANGRKKLMNKRDQH
jgi:hypothetical protein